MPDAVLKLVSGCVIGSARWYAHEAGPMEAGTADRNSRNCSTATDPRMQGCSAMAWRVSLGGALGSLLADQRCTSRRLRGGDEETLSAEEY